MVVKNSINFYFHVYNIFIVIKKKIHTKKREILFFEKLTIFKNVYFYYSFLFYLTFFFLILTITVYFLEFMCFKTTMFSGLFRNNFFLYNQFFFFILFFFLKGKKISLYDKLNFFLLYRKRKKN